MSDNGIILSIIDDEMCDLHLKNMNVQENHLRTSKVRDKLIESWLYDNTKIRIFHHDELTDYMDEEEVINITKMTHSLTHVEKIMRMVEKYNHPVICGKDTLIKGQDSKKSIISSIRSVLFAVD